MPSPYSCPKTGANELSTNPALRDFISDAAVHKKFVAFTPEAQTLVKRVLGIAKPDAGMIELSNAAAAKSVPEDVCGLEILEAQINSLNV